MTHIIDETAYNNAIIRNIKINAQKTFLKSESNRIALDFVEQNAHKGGFYQSLANAFETYGKLTENQVNAVHASIAKLETKKAEWKEKQQAENSNSVHVGTIKARHDFTLTCNAIIQLNGQAFGYYDDGISFMQIFKDETGNVFKYTGKTVLIEKNQTAILK